MNYRLVALDLDGTVVDRALTVDDRDVAAIAAAISAGVHVVACSGRPFPAALPWVERLGLRDPVVCYQGGQVRSLDGAILLDNSIDHALAMEVVTTCRERGLEVHAYRDDRLVTEQDRWEARLYAEHAGMQLNVVDDLDTALGPTTPKVVSVAPGEVVAQLLPEFRQRWLGRLNVETSVAEYLEMTSVLADKRLALEFLAGQLGIGRQETIAVGDGRNDRTMIEWAGFGVAVDGAPDEVVAVAREVIPPPPSGAIAALLREVGVLQKPPPVRSR